MAKTKADSAHAPTRKTAESIGSKKAATSIGDRFGEDAHVKDATPKSERNRRQSSARTAKSNTAEIGSAASTLKERVEQAQNHSEPLPSAAESNAIRFAISIPGLLDEVREQAFVELAGVVERMLAEHGHRLTRSEAENVAWWIVDHPDDVPDV